MGPFNCYVTLGGVGGVKIFQKSVTLQLIFPLTERYRGGGGGVKNFQKSVTLQLIFPLTECYRGWGGVKICPKKRYVTVEWPLMVSGCSFI